MIVDFNRSSKIACVYNLLKFWIDSVVCKYFMYFFFFHADLCFHYYHIVSGDLLLASMLLILIFKMTRTCVIYIRKESLARKCFFHVTIYFVYNVIYYHKGMHMKYTDIQSLCISLPFRICIFRATGILSDAYISE